MKSLFLFLFFLCLAQAALGFFDRRKDPFAYRWGYYIYPIVQDVPGLGQVSGVGMNLVDIGNTDLDFGGFNVSGEFRARGGYFLNQHLIPHHLVVDWGAFDYSVATTLYDRGIDSSKDQFFLPEVQGKGWQGQLTFMFLDRQIEGFQRVRQETYKVIQVYDQDGRPFTNFDNGDLDFKNKELGFKLDFTDDRLDPRQGIRLEWLQKTPENSDPWISDFVVLDQNATLYLPLGEYSTWTFNGYRSQARVTRQAETDPTKLKTVLGLGCAALQDALSRIYCRATQDKRVAERIALNNYGRATPMGGTQRLRAFPNARFAAGNDEFYGTELRYNLNEESTPINWGLIKGVRNNFQLALFYERGTVWDGNGNERLWRHSYGVGFRLIFEGVTLRADWAKGEEGGQSQIFIDYPWGLFAIDNSTR